jgi:hypothetical protein
MSEAPVEYGGQVLGLPVWQFRETPEDDGRCYYCGDPATSIDHVVPQSMLQTLRLLGDDEATAVLARHGRVMLVPCCRECNSILGNKYFDTLRKRKEHLKRRLRERNRKLLSMPPWTDRELGDLRGRLRDYVIASQVKREISCDG